jgi:hypothetical protein
MFCIVTVVKLYMFCFVTVVMVSMFGIVTALCVHVLYCDSGTYTCIVV